MTMNLQRLLGYTRKAVETYHMIEEGDKIAIGISGGKDSLTLLYALHGLQRFYPKHFEICAITVDLGLGMDFEPIRKLCEELQVEYVIVPTQIYQIVFEERKETNPCSLCAKMRKGALNNAIIEMGCNKIAYAHHKDDIIETLMMSLIYEGRIHTFAPNTHLERMNLNVIRPLLYVSESEIISFRYRYQLPVCESKCPADGYTKRQFAKELIKDLEKENPKVKNGMFSAVINSRIDGWEQEVLHEI